MRSGGRQGASVKGKKAMSEYVDFILFKQESIDVIISGLIEAGKPKAKNCEFCGGAFGVIEEGSRYAHYEPELVGKRLVCQCAGARLYRTLVGCPNIKLQDSLEFQIERRSKK